VPDNALQCSRLPLIEIGFDEHRHTVAQHPAMPRIHARDLCGGVRIALNPNEKLFDSPNAGSIGLGKRQRLHRPASMLDLGLELKRGTRHGVRPHRLERCRLPVGGALSLVGDEVFVADNAELKGHVFKPLVPCEHAAVKHGHDVVLAQLVPITAPARALSQNYKPRVQ
jgi:hypothetical protein